MSRRRAFGLAETLIASAIIAMVLIGLYGISASAARSAQIQSARVTAAALAEAVIDNVRYERELYWRGITGGANPGRTADGFWTYLSGKGPVVSGNSLNWASAQSGWTDLVSVSGYTQSLTVQKDASAIAGNLTYMDGSGVSQSIDSSQAASVASSLLKVTATVVWSGPTGDETYVLSTYLTDWLGGML